MQKVIDEEREIRGMKIFGVLLPFLPKLLFKFSIDFLKFKRAANNAGKIFRKELMRQGLDKQTASELTQIYMKGSEIKNYMQSFRLKFPLN